MTVSHCASWVFLAPDERMRGGGPRPMTVAERVARFFEKIQIDPGGCWLWTGARLPQGYGQVAAGRFPDGRVLNLATHVAMWRLTHDGQTVPDGLEVMHSCHVRHCVNPDHLSVGTRAVNIAQAVALGSYDGPKRGPVWTAEDIAACLTGPRGTTARLARERGATRDGLQKRIARARRSQRQQERAA